MTENEKLTGLVADVRQQLAYYKELGVELLDVKVADAASANDQTSVANVTVHTPNVPNVTAIPREHPDRPIAAKSEPVKTNAKRSSKLSALPSLSNRVPVRAHQ